VFVRIDIPLPQQLCQAVHAAHEAGIHLASKDSDISSVVVCSIKNEQELLKVEDKLAQHSIKSVMFREPDVDNQATALATEPIPASLRRFLSSYPLWR
jgi:hypothetical protein